MNANNDNLRQYVRAYSELMLEIRHMHELDHVCHFVVGLPVRNYCTLSPLRYALTKNPVGSGTTI